MNIKKLTKGQIALIVLGSLALLVISVTWSSYNTFVGYEEDIQAIDKEMQSVHANGQKNIRGQGIAVEKYGEIFSQGLKIAIEGRYGKTGSQAAFQWLKEENPTIPPEIMQKLQQAIEATYNKFEATQRTKIEMVAAYRKKLRRPPSSWVAKGFGFPTIDMKAADSIITSAETKRDFETGELSDPDPFGENKK